MKNKWLGLAALIPGLAMVFLDQTILPVALPTIQKELGAGSVALQWTVNSYLLTTAMFVLVAGKWGDRVGHLTSSLWGIFIFGISSLFCGMSPNVEWLIGWRALQGVGAAMMIPAMSALLGALFSAHERGKAMGLNVSISSLFMILGPLVGGYLTEDWSWRGIFWINVPVAILGILMGRAFLPRCSTTQSKIDFWGFAAFVICIGSAIYWLMQGREWGWKSMESMIWLLVAVLSGVLLVWREKKAQHPFLDLSLFKHPIYTAVNITVGMIQFILMISVFRSIYFQNAMGYSPAQTGVLTFVSTLPVLFCPLLGGFLSDKIGPKFPIGLGFSFLIFSFAWFYFSPAPNLAPLLIALTAFGIGIPLVFTPAYSSAMGAVPPKKYGVAFGMLATMRNFSATLGVALLGMALDGAHEHYLQVLAADLSAKEAEGFVSGANEVPQALEGAFVLSMKEGFGWVNGMLAILLFIVCIAVLTVYHRKSTHRLPEMPAEGWD